MSIIKSKTFWFVAAAVVVAVLAFIVFNNGVKPLAYLIKNQTVQESVRITGKIKALQSASLSFERQGRVDGVYAKEGQKVLAGQVLMRIDNSQTSADLLQARSTLEAAQAKLSELKRGTRPEELAVEKVKVEDAEVAVQTARQDAVDAVRSAFTKVDDSVRSKVDQLFTNPQSANPRFEQTVTDPTLRTAIESGRFAVEQMFSIWDADISALNVSSDLPAVLSRSSDKISTVSDFLDDVALAVNSLKSNTSLSQTTLDGYRADIYTARVNVDAAADNVANALQTLRKEETALSLARSELVLKEAGISAEEVAFQEAKVKEAQAAVNSFEAKSRQSVILAPFSGVIAKVVVKQGEITTPGSEAVKIVSDGSLVVEADIPEVLIGEVRPEMQANYVLDAFPGKNFTGKVLFVEPAETVVGGVPNYKVTFSINDAGKAVLSGMTADINISIRSVDGALAVPISSIVIDPVDMRSYVGVVMDNGEIIRTEVVTGIRGSNGFVEIKSGLKEGQRVIVDFQER